MHSMVALASLVLLVVVMSVGIPSVDSQEEGIPSVDSQEEGIPSVDSQEEGIPSVDSQEEGIPSVDSQEEDTTWCSWTEWDPKCSPSGWVSFIVGDLTLAIIIAVMIYYLQRRTNTRLAEALMSIQKVLKQEEESKRRQVVFVTQSLKNYFSGILMIAGLMNHRLVGAKTYEDIPKTIRDKQDYMTTMANHASDTLNLATHILDPVLTEQIRRFVSTIENIRPESGVGKGFPRYDAIKNEIASITAKLDAHVGNDDEILK